MMSKRNSILGGLIGHEVRVHLRSPIWIIGLLAAGLLAYKEGGSYYVRGWPTINQALRGFQLASTMIIGVMAFLLTAGSLARDLGGVRRDLVFSRPVSIWLYVGGKYLGGVLFVLGVVLVLLLGCLIKPLFYGVFALYDARPYLIVMGVSVIPMILYTCALAVFITSLARRVIIAMPIYLIYFFSAALFRHSSLRHKPPGYVDLLDFSMRLYPGGVRVPIAHIPIADVTFAHLLDPVSPDLIHRAVVYTLLSCILIAGAAVVLKRRRRS